MVEINNQRKGVPRYAGVVGGTDNGRQAEIMVIGVIVGGELFTDYSDHPRKLVTLNPKLKSTRAWDCYQLLSRWWDAYRKRLGLKDFSPKSQDAVALQQIKERGALPMIDLVISVRQSTVAAISGLHCRALVMVSSGIRLTAWLQNSKKRAERSERLMWSLSHRDYLHSGCHRLPVLGC